MIAVEEDVLGLDVTVQHTLGVRVLERVGDARDDRERFSSRKARLSPQQVAVVPITSSHDAYAVSLAQQLVAAGVRAEADLSSERMNAKIRNAQLMKVPYMLVVGDQEVQDQTVALRYQAFPYQRFGHYLGEVREVGRTILQPQEAALPLPVQEPVYRITVKLPAQRVQAYGQSLALQSGMVLDADIWVDRRRLIEWVVDPLLSVVGRV